MSIFGFKKRQYWDRVFSKCDFDFAADLLVHTFAGGIIPDKLAKLLSAYTNNPCRETAISLIEFDKDEFLKFFVDNETILASMMVEKSIDRDEISKGLRKPKNLLMQEPEFEAYCDACLEDDPDKCREVMKKNESLLVAKGYSTEAISSAFAEYMADISDY